jgi:alkylation response protein AidB-like acyl-CoA dehydrogenase
MSHDQLPSQLMEAAGNSAAPLPLTQLSDEETLFQASVRRFARERLAPHVRAMDDAGVFRHDLLQEFFDLGLMAIEVPEEFGGQGGAFFQSILAIEELSRVDPSAAVIVDVQNTLFLNAILRWGTVEQKHRWLPRASKDTVASYALSEAGSGSDAFALTTRAVKDADGDGYRLTGRKLWITNAGEAARLSWIPGRQERGQAGNPRLLHLRADSGRMPSAQGQRGGRSGQGLQDRDRDAE